MLSLASNQTVIQLVLRNPLDTQVAKTPGTAVVELFAVNGPKKRPDPAKVYVRAPKPLPVPLPVEVKVAPPARQSFVMEVINGGKKRRNEIRYDSRRSNKMSSEGKFYRLAAATGALWALAGQPTARCRRRTSGPEIRRWW